MHWLEGLCRLYEQRCGELTDEMKEKILRTESAQISADPPVWLYRYSKIHHTFPTTPNGTPGYDPMGALAMDVMGVSSDVEYVDDNYRSFDTIAHSELSLPRPVNFKMIGKAPGFFSGLRKKPLDHWKVKGDCPEDLAAQIAAVIQATDPDHKHFYQVALYPSDQDPSIHILTVRTNKLPMILDTFNSVSNYYATDADGRRLSSKEAALLCMDNLVKINVECYRLITQQIGSED